MSDRNDLTWILKDKFSHCFVGIMAYYLWADYASVSKREVHLHAEHHAHKVSDGREFIRLIENRRCLKKDDIMNYWVNALEKVDELRGAVKKKEVEPIELPTNPAEVAMCAPVTEETLNETVETVAIPAPISMMPPPPAMKKKKE